METEKKKPSLVRHFTGKLRFWLTLVLVAAVVVMGALLWLQSRKNAEPVPPTITSAGLSEQIQPLGELATVKYLYTNAGSFSNQNTFYDWNVPLTTKRFILTYSGVIKAGIDMQKVEVEVTDTTIRITLPPAQILSHEMDENSIEVLDETNNIFNPITVEDYSAFFAEQKGTAEQRALDNGLLEQADEQARQTIEGFIRALDETETGGKTVEFVAA